jgi:hypothetical protein
MIQLYATEQPGISIIGTIVEGFHNVACIAYPILAANGTCIGSTTVMNRPATLKSSVAAPLVEKTPYEVFVKQAERYDRLWPERGRDRKDAL